MQRLMVVVSDSDLLAQVLRGVPLVLLALWLAAPWWNAFGEGGSLFHLLAWAPRGAWAAVCAGIALLHAYSVYRQAWHLRQAGLMLSFLWWLLLVSLNVLDGQAWRAITALFAAQAITAFIFYVRLGMTPRRGSMAEGPRVALAAPTTLPPLPPPTAADLARAQALAALAQAWLARRERRPRPHGTNHGGRAA